MNQYNYDTCGECPFKRGSKGLESCKIYAGFVNATDKCKVGSTPMCNSAAVDVLHYFQKWRRGADIDMPPPKVVGKSIDVAIRILRQYNRQMELFANEAGDGYNKDRIFIAAHSKEEAVSVYQNNKTKHRYPDDGWFKVPHAHTDCDKPMILIED